MALSTVSDVKSVIGVDMSSTDETAVTNIFIQAADAAIKNYVGYELEYATGIVDTFDGNNQEELFTSVAPIISVTSVVEDAVTLTEGNQEHFVVYKPLGKIKKTGGQAIFKYKITKCCCNLCSRIFRFRIISRRYSNGYKVN